MYRSTPGATVKGIAADLGVTRGALAEWVKARPEGPGGSGGDVRAQGGLGASGSGAGGQLPDGRGRTAGAAARLAALEAENAALRADAARRDAEHDAEVQKLSTERDILRQAAKYFAGETRW